MSSGIEARFAEALLDPHLPVPEGVIAARGEPDPIRFSVYRNNVHVGLVEALARAFPVVRALVGEEFFRAMARLHVARCKPRTPVLLQYGAEFPSFMAGFAPAASLPYLADVARLERARHEAYHAAEAPLLTPAILAGEHPERLAGARLVAHPAARLVESTFAIGSIWTAHQATPCVPAVATGHDETVLVTRPEATVRTTILPAGDIAFARHLLAGETLGEAAAGAGDGFDAGRALLGLLSLGTFTAIHPNSEERSA